MLLPSTFIIAIPQLSIRSSFPSPFKRQPIQMKGESTSPAYSPPNPTPPDMWFVEYLTPHDAYHHGVRSLLHSSRSRYQSITVADTGAYGRALFLDGKMQTAENDEALYHEPLVHVPCILNPHPKHVLILGGADGGAAREALKWRSVEKVVVVDIDQGVVDACREFLPNIAAGGLDDDRCELIIGDALVFVDQTDALFDVIICDLTDPMEYSPSLKLFTLEFFTKLHNRLRPDGTVSIQVGPSSLIESPTIMPRICATLRHVFTTVHPYQVFVPTYGSPLGMAVGTKKQSQLPDEAKVNALFKLQVTSNLCVLDGLAFQGLFALPKSTRETIAEENHIFTLENTAKAFGKGNLVIN